MIFCSLKQYETADEFSSDLNRLLKTNGLPSISIGNVIPPIISVDKPPKSIIPVIPNDDAKVHRLVSDDSDGVTGVLVDDDSDDDSYEPSRADCTPEVSHVSVNKKVLRSSGTCSQQPENLVSPVATAVRKFTKLNAAKDNKLEKNLKKRYKQLNK